MYGRIHGIVVSIMTIAVAHAISRSDITLVLHAPLTLHFSNNYITIQLQLSTYCCNPTVHFYLFFLLITTNLVAWDTALTTDHSNKETLSNTR